MTWVSWGRETRSSGENIPKTYISSRNLKFTKITRFKNVVYLYLVNEREYTGLARRDCIFTVLSKIQIAYKKNKPQCSRMTSGFSDMTTGYADLTTCDTTLTRITRQIMLGFGAILIVIYLICIGVYWKVKTKTTPMPQTLPSKSINNLPNN